MKLIPMTEFVRNAYDFTESEISDKNMLKRILKYSDFLTQQLTLEMFIACDEDGNVLKKPYLYDTWEAGSSIKPRLDDGNKQAFEQYQRAKERILFEGFEIDDRMIPNNPNDFHLLQKSSRLSVSVRKGKTVEAIIRQAEEIQLTQTVLNKIGL